jgi:hypothetical protein
LGVLQTIGTLILTLESTPDVLLHMESILMPVIRVTLENKLYGMSNESCSTLVLAKSNRPIQ